MLDVAILATALAMDAMAVAAAVGAAGIGRGHGLRLSAIFGTFHLVMAAIGCAAGEVAERWIGAWDHWVVFGALVGLGVKMIVSAIHPPRIPTTSSSWTVLLTLGFVTSIDAIAAGVTVPLLDPPRLLSIATIGALAATLAFVGFHTGARLGGRSRILEVAGAIALIAIATKTLLSHL